MNSTEKKQAKKQAIDLPSNLPSDQASHRSKEENKEKNKEKNKKNPDVAKLEWKEPMVERYKELTDLQALQTYSTQYLRKAIRVNTLKSTVKEVTKRLDAEWILTPVPWCKEGFWIEHRAGERTDIGNLKEHALGYIYVQDPASMIPPIVLNPEPGDTVLDCCAAPGSKTTQMAALMNNEGSIVANDVDHSRLAALGINVQRMGCINVAITQSRGQELKGVYTKILLDAPCSATGTIRRSPSAIKMWSVRNLERITQLQKSLLTHVWTLLEPGGIIVYSTCSLEPEENEMMVDWALRKLEGCEVLPIKLNIKHAPAVTEFQNKTLDPAVKNTLRIFPQDNDTEGFFVAKLTKKKEKT